MIKKLTSTILFFSAFQMCNANGANNDLAEIVVVGSMSDVSTVPGSGVAIDLEQLERFDYIDLHQVLSSVPGVYVREEDGYGLRPNIGIRGAVARRVPRAVRSRHAVRRPRSRRSSSRHHLRSHGKHARGGPGGGVQETRGGSERVPAGAARYNAGRCGRSEALPVSTRRIVAVGADGLRPRRLANVDAKFNRSGGERRGLCSSRERRARAGDGPSGCVDAARRD